MCMSCIVVAVMCYCCCLATMLCVGLVDSVCHVLFLLCGDHASCGSCRQCMSCAVSAVWRPCFVWVLSTVYVMCCVCCLATMLHVSLVDSVCHCCFCCLATMLHAGLVDSVCHVLFILSGNHALCGSCQQCMSCAVFDHASCGSCRQCMSCAVFAVWRPCFVRVLSTVYVMCCVCCLATMLHVAC